MKVILSENLPIDLNLFSSPSIEFRILKPEEKKERKNFINILKDADGFISLLSDPIDDELLQQTEKLKIISNYAVGFDNIDLEAAKKRHVWVTNTPDVLTDATADLAFSLLLGISRRIQEGDALIRSNKWKGWDPNQLLGVSLQGKTLGIYGYGRIGKAMAKRGKAFGMNIIYTNRNPIQSENTQVDFQTLLKNSDFISLHAPLNQDSQYAFNQTTLLQMKKGSFIINTARGKLIKEQDLVNALKNNHLAGAGLDVFEDEPLVNSQLIQLPNTLLLPHVGSATKETRKKMAEIALNNVMQVLLKKEKPSQALFSLDF